MIKKLLIFLTIISAPYLMNAQCGPSYSDNANFDSAGSSIGISFTTDSSCGGTLASVTFNSGFSPQPTGPGNTIGFARVRLYEGNGLGGNVLGTLNNVNISVNSTFDFSTLMISISASSQYTIIVSNFTLPTLTGRGFNGPFFPPYTGGVLYRDDVERLGEHLAFSVNIDNSTLSVNDIEANEISMRAYPNPATNSIQLTNLQQQENYAILDVSGRKVLQGITKQNETIDIQKLSKGIYFLRLDKKVLKFIKE